MVEVKRRSVATRSGSLAAWRRFMRLIAPDRIVGGRLRTDARSMLHLLGEPLPHVDGEREHDWLRLLLAYLRLKGVDGVAGLWTPHSDTLEALAEWGEHRPASGDVAAELWLDLAASLDAV